MIYSMYWQGHKAAYAHMSYAGPKLNRFRGRPDNDPPKFNLQETLARFIKESKDDSFVFIVTRNGQYAAFKQWIKESELEEYVVFEPPVGVTNPNYSNRNSYGPEHDGNLKMVIMASKNHSLKDQFVYKKGVYGDK